MTDRHGVDPFMRGVKLFNQRQFFACHELWEEVWKPSAGETRRLYQGLIQAAAALHHASRGNRAGALSLWSKAKAKLELSPDQHRRLSIAQLRDDLKDYFKSAPFAAPPRLKPVKTTK